MKKFISTLSLIFILTNLSFGQTDNEYREALQTMFKVSGSEEIYQTAISQMFTMFKEQYATVKEETWVSLEAEFKNTSINDLIELLTPTYQKHLTLEEIKGLIEFYETPVGKKYAQKSPLIMQESMQIGQQWGMKIGEEFAKKMKDKGY
jgi:uncharacterized protein